MILALMHEESKNRDGIHVTDLTGCLRRSFLKKTLVPAPAPLSSYATRLYGSLIHDAFAQHDDGANSKLRIDFGDVAVVGTADGVYDERSGTVEDLKTTRWLKKYLLPYGNHLKQILYYATMLWKSGRPVRRGTIRYVDLSGPSRCRTCGLQHALCRCGTPIPKSAHNGFASYTVVWSERDFETAYDEMGNAAHALKQALDTGAPLPGDPSWECRYCDFFHECPNAGQKGPDAGRKGPDAGQKGPDAGQKGPDARSE